MPGTDLKTSPIEIPPADLALLQQSTLPRLAILGDGEDDFSPQLLSGLNATGKFTAVKFDSLRQAEDAFRERLVDALVVGACDWSYEHQVGDAIKEMRREGVPIKEVTKEEITGDCLEHAAFPATFVSDLKFLLMVASRGRPSSD